MIPRPLVLVSLPLLGLCACAPAPRPDAGPPLAGPAARPDTGPGAAPAASSGLTSLEGLSLTAALAHLDAHHPELEGLRRQVAAASARAEAADALPAPAALVRAENVPLHRGSSFDQGNYILGLAFELPLQGRLAAARAREEREGELVSRSLELRRHELLRRARDAFASALAAQRAAGLHADSAAAAESLAALLERRVALGDLTPDESTWAAADAARARLDAQQSASVARRALARLGEAIGASGPVASVAGDLEQTVGAPELAALLRRVEQAPAVRRADAEVALRQAALELARAERIPDLRLELAYRRLEQTNQHSLDAGVLVPFPFLGGSTARAEAADLELSAARARAMAARLGATRAVRDAWERLTVAVARAEALSLLLPRVDAALAAVAVRLERGDISALQAIPPRRMAISWRLDHVEALGEALRAWADLDAALGEVR